MKENNVEFPKDFLWGTATSAYQVEGAYDEDGKGESIWDRYCHNGLGCVVDNAAADVTIDHYHRLEEDLDVLQKLNCKIYRFSIAWTRILPDGVGEINQKGIDFYNRLIDGLLKRNIQPAVTLFHWDLPAKLQNLGGWLNRDIVNWFVKYAEICFDNFSDRVNYWFTINEPYVFTFSAHALGAIPPCLKDLQAGIDSAHNALLSHGKTIELFRKKGYKGKIGIALDIIPKIAVSDREEDIYAAKVANATTQEYFYDAIIKGKYPDVALKEFKKFGYAPDIKEDDMQIISQRLDFLGVNYYLTQGVKSEKSKRFGYDTVEREGHKKYGFGWVLDPNGLYDVLKTIKEDTKGRLPVIISENGIFIDNDEPDSDGKIVDFDRIEYIERHVEALSMAIKDGVPVKGYTYWSAFDNFEWNNGYSVRFGLVYIDYKTQKRTIKKSGEWFADFVRNH